MSSAAIVIGTLRVNVLHSPGSSCSKHCVSFMKLSVSLGIIVLKIVIVNRSFSHCFCTCMCRSGDVLFLDNRRDFTKMGQTDFKLLVFSMKSVIINFFTQLRSRFFSSLRCFIYNFQFP